MKESKFKLQSREAEEGLLSLRSDAVKVAGWLREKNTKRKLGGKSRPIGVPPTKKINGKIHTFHSWYDTLPEAREMCFAISGRDPNQICHITKVDNTFIVYKRKRK